MRRRAPAGERVQATAPGAWKNVTLISGMRKSGVTAPIALPGATDRLVFETYVEQALVPELRAGFHRELDKLDIAVSDIAVLRFSDFGVDIYGLITLTRDHQMAHDAPWPSDAQAQPTLDTVRREL